MKINMAKKKTKKAAEKALNIDNILFNCRDILRAARNSGSFFEKRDMMLNVIKLRNDEPSRYYCLDGVFI